VIVVDTFSGDKIVKYLDSLYQLDKTLDIRLFGLYVTAEELKRRLDLRSDSEFRDLGICKRLNDDLLKIKYKEESQIDTTGLIPKQTAEIIWSKISEQSSNTI
jgi:hypothetical protein